MNQTSRPPEVGMGETPVLRCEVPRRELIAAAILIENIEVRASGSAIQAKLDELLTELRSGRAGGGEERRAAIRRLLRNGRYRASGRGKPAQEYLAKVYATTGSLDLINNAVDVNNIVSLRHGLPISAFDAAKLQGDLVLRLGSEGERYVFNASGQELDCRDLMVVADARGPIGSPVKDSQATKLFPGAKFVLYVVYGSRETCDEDEILSVARELGEMLSEDCPEALAHEPRLITPDA